MLSPEFVEKKKKKENNYDLYHFIHTSIPDQTMVVLFHLPCPWLDMLVWWALIEMKPEIESKSVALEHKILAIFHQTHHYGVIRPLQLPHWQEDPWQNHTRQCLFQNLDQLSVIRLLVHQLHLFGMILQKNQLQLANKLIDRHKDEEK